MQESYKSSNVLARIAKKKSGSLLEAPHRVAWLRDWPYFSAWIRENDFISAWSRESTCMRDAWKRRNMCVNSWNHSKTCVISWKACFSSKFLHFYVKISIFFLDCVNAWKGQKNLNDCVIEDPLEGLVNEWVGGKGSWKTRSSNRKFPGELEWVKDFENWFESWALIGK